MSTVARTLLANGRRVRAVVRNEAKARESAARGAEIARADVLDADALARAFEGTEGVFALIPPYFAPEPGFLEATAVVASFRATLERAAPPKVVALSPIGAQHARGSGLIQTLHILEHPLADLADASGFVRGGWFVENAAWDVVAARTRGEIDSFLQLLERAVRLGYPADRRGSLTVGSSSGGRWRARGRQR